VVGAGWRAEMFWRVAAGLDWVECVGAVVRSPRSLPVPVFTSVAECLDAAGPDFVVTAVPREANPAVIEEVVGRGVAVLAETPPATDVAGLRSLWARVGESNLVQVAEQYLLMPAHAAGAAVVRSGAVGTVTQVQVSSTHDYHAVSLIRGLLDAGSGPVTVRATRTSGPLVDPLSRAGWTDDATPKPASTVLATLDFGDGRSGVYDFTDNQWHNQLRFRRILIARATLRPRRRRTAPLVRGRAQ
jgi:predicted dehydrogenase